jgi:hypothetical protein
MPRKRIPKKPTIGRPLKVMGAKVDPEEVVRLLVEGVVVQGQDGPELRRLPSQREVAKQYGVAHSLISRIAAKHDCARRHEQYRAAHPEPFEAYERWREALNAGGGDSSTGSARGAGEAGTATTTTASAAPVGARDQGEGSAAGGPVGSTTSRRKPGKPRRCDSPNVPWNEVDRLLVLGEVVELPDGTTTTRFPSVRELGRRYGISHSGIVDYSKKHQCERRRETAQERLIAKTEEKVLEMRATAAAITKDDVLRIIDKFLLKFEHALDEDRVRYDVAADFNTMARLKEFIMGGADSRQETNTVFTLEMLQERHARMLRDLRAITPAEMGVVDAEGRLVESGCCGSRSGGIDPGLDAGGIPADAPRREG